MFRFCLTVIAVLALTTASIGIARAADDSRQSADTTFSSYLHSHRLPLVEARIITKAAGQRELLLYGFVATEFGKRDAQEQARGYFIDEPDITIVNRIKVRPELLSLGKPANNSTPATGQAAADNEQNDSAANADNQTAEIQNFPDPIRDREAYIHQGNDDDLLVNNGLGAGGIPLALVIVGSGFVFPPAGAPILAPPVYYHSFPPVIAPPTVFSPPPVVVIRHSYTPPPMVFGGFPSPFAPSPFPAGPAPMFPATGGMPPFPTTINPGFNTINPGFGAFQGGFGGGGFGSHGGFGAHR